MSECAQGCPFLVAEAEAEAELVGDFSVGMQAVQLNAHHELRSGPNSSKIQKKKKKLTGESCTSA